MPEEAPMPPLVKRSTARVEQLEEPLVDNDASVAMTAKKSKREQKKEVKAEKSVSDISGLKKKKKSKKSKKADSEKDTSKK